MAREECQRREEGEQKRRGEAREECQRREEGEQKRRGSRDGRDLAWREVGEREDYVGRGGR